MPKASTKPTPKRRNLSAKERKKAIIKSAAQLVDDEGWEKLTISALARRSGITRQLIHLHFPKLENLMVDTATYLFQKTYLETSAASASYPESSIQEVLSEGMGATLNLPPGRSKALLKVISTAYSEGNELSPFARSMRHLITNIWAPSIAKAFELHIKEAKPMAWMLVMAFWGGFHLMDDGDHDKEEIIERYSWMIHRMFDGVQANKDKTSAIDIATDKGLNELLS